MISVITPTVRPEGLALVEKALQEQSFRDFHWLIVSPEKVMDKVLKIWPDPGKDVTVGFQNEPKKKKGDVWALNKAYNQAIETAKGELIISWQDYTYAKPDTLEMFWKHFEDEPKTLISAVGNKYENDNWDIMLWKDPRERDDQGSFYQVYPADIEWNLCSVPRQALYDVGGFLEDFDQRYGMDGYNVNERINAIGGYDFKIDQSIKSYSLEHGRLHGEKWDKMNWLKDDHYAKMRDRMIDEGKWPVAPYLTANVGKEKRQERTKSVSKK